MAPDVSGRLEDLAGARRRIEDLRFVVVGAYVVDCFVRVSRLPTWGGELEARSIHTSPGGKALNQAVALARLGAQVTAVGVVGDDGLGRDVLAALAREGIDAGFVETRPKVPTTVCLCFVSDDGESTIVWHIDEDVAVTRDTVRTASSTFQRADAVLITFELPVSAIREAIGAAHRCGARVIVQPAPVLADPAGALSLPWDQVDVLVPNEAEARALLGDDQVGRDVPADGLAIALAAGLGVGTVVVTLGAAGCVTHAVGVTRRYPAPKAEAVDTTSASDAFTATFAAHITSGASGADAIQAAQAAAAWAVGHIGGHESMPQQG
ncbi:MAG TPA: PfkB family carbohydrate kinase [Streptosporangiaceae bacterium]|nr:PfkB family carbohydrate kinase [Streptosporangiaceae bacterium]